jgi:hypothetical protein
VKRNLAAGSSGLKIANHQFRHSILSFHFWPRVGALWKATNGVTSVHGVLYIVRCLLQIDRCSYGQYCHKM